MLVNFDTEILNLDGSAIIESGKALTMGAVSIGVLVNPIANADGRPENLPGDTKVKYFELARRIYAGGEVEISVDEASDLKKRIDRGCAYPLIVAQAWALLDPKG